MKHYLVEWSMDILADSPEEAAEKALKIHRDPTSIATIFKITPVSQIRIIDTAED